MLLGLSKLADTLFALCWRLQAGNGGNGHAGGERAAQGFGDIFGGGDEATEDDRLIAFFDQFGDELGSLLQLGILRSLERIGLTRHIEQTAAGFALIGLIALVLILEIAAGRDVDAFSGV